MHLDPSYLHMPTRVPKVERNHASHLSLASMQWHSSRSVLPRQGQREITCVLALCLKLHR